MNRAERINRRRGELIARAAAQRTELAMALGWLRTPLALADKGVAAVGLIRKHPRISVAVVTAVVAIYPRRALGLAQRAFLLWRGVRWVNSSLRALTSRTDMAA